MAQALAGVYTATPLRLEVSTGARASGKLTAKEGDYSSHRTASIIWVSPLFGIEGRIGQGKRQPRSSTSSQMTTEELSRSLHGTHSLAGGSSPSTTVESQQQSLSSPQNGVGHFH